MDYERYYRFGPFTVRVDYYRGSAGHAERDFQIRRGGDAVCLHYTQEFGKTAYYVVGRYKTAGLHITWTKADGLGIAAWCNCPTLIIE